MNYLLCVGNYSVGAPDDGIRLYRINPDSGKMTLLKTIQDVENPSFVAFTHDRKYAYVCEELKDKASIKAFKLTDSGTEWEEIGKATVPGCGMCHLTVSPDDHFILASNFTSGNVCCVRIDENGVPGENTDNIFLTGHSVRTDWFQDHSRCHETVFTPDGECIVVADMGGDRLMIYEFDTKNGRYKPNPKQTELVADPGDGPRHHIFSKDGKMFYSVSEISANIVVYRYFNDSHTFKRIQKVSTVPEYFKDWHTASEVIISENGKYLYVSNRGYDTIACFGILENGKLSAEPVYFDSLGAETRMFCFSPDERFMIIANQKSNRINICPYDKETGEIGKPVHVEKTVFPAFVESWKIDE